MLAIRTRSVPRATPAGKPAVRYFLNTRLPGSDSI